MKTTYQYRRLVRSGSSVVVTVPSIHLISLGWQRGDVLVFEKQGEALCMRRLEQAPQPWFPDKSSSRFLPRPKPSPPRAD